MFIDVSELGMCLMKPAAAELAVSARRLRLRAAAPSALEEPCAGAAPPPHAEPFRQHHAGSRERTELARELQALCRRPPDLSLVVGSERLDVGARCAQPMPFDHRRAAANFRHAPPAAVERAFSCAAHAQHAWERTPVERRCCLFERVADLLAGAHRQRVVAAAMVGSACTAGRAELDLCQLVDQIRMDCHHLRSLTRSPAVVGGGEEARNMTQIHGLEGFWAAISGSDSFASAAQLALAPALVGNGVVWKPSDRAALAAYRVFETLERAGVPPGVVSFVPCEEGAFLEAAVARPDLAGVSFGGTSQALERVWRRVGENVERHRSFPRVVGYGGARSWHAVHGSADLAAAAAGTARAAFEQAGQRAGSCSRVYVARSLLEPFVERLTSVTRALVVCHPLDYRCFLSAVASAETWAAASEAVSRGVCEGARLACGGRADDSVGYYVEPTVLLVDEPQHWLLTAPLRGPLLAVHAFPDADLSYLEWAVAQAPFAMSGSVYAQDVSWAREAVGALRDSAVLLCVNERCSELVPGQQSLGGGRKSGSGAKVGAASCLLQYGSERSLREVAQPCRDVTYEYMDECPAPARPAKERD